MEKQLREMRERLKVKKREVIDDIQNLRKINKSTRVKSELGGDLTIGSLPSIRSPSIKSPSNNFLTMNENTPVYKSRRQSKLDTINALAQFQVKIATNEKSPNDRILASD